MNVRSMFLASALTMTLISTGTAMAARDSISIVGSSTVYPFATVVAEQFGKGSNFKTPKIESTGTGGGFKLFCGGVGVTFPDISNASRAIKDSEKETCAKNGVTDIIELKIGYDGIAVANTKSAPQMKLTRKEIFLALAKDVPDPANDGKADPQPLQDLERDQPRAARHRHRGSRSAADLRNPRRLHRNGAGCRRRGIRVHQGHGQERQGHVQEGQRDRT